METTSGLTFITPRHLTRSEVLRDKSGALRITTQFVRDGECIRWTGVLSPKGYGTIGVHGRNHRVHRVSYELFIGPIPEGLEIDHVAERGCRFRDCINPEHLEAVTHAENLRRVTFRRTHCARGHEFTEEDTRINEQGWRICRLCHRAERQVARKKRAVCETCGAEVSTNNIARHRRNLHDLTATPSTPNGASS